MIRIDARGMRCPWPALRLARALRAGGDEPIEVLADDPGAARELAAVAAAACRELTLLAPDHFRIDCGSKINALFTLDA